MSSKETHIYIDRLKSGEEEEISSSLDPIFLDIENDTDISCSKPVQVTGKAYIAGDFLIGELDAKAEFTGRCAVCSDMFPFEVTLHMWRFEKPLEEIRGGMFDFKEALREELLVQLPLFPQCKGSSCGNREKVSKFFAQVKEEEPFRPFQDLLD